MFKQVNWREYLFVAMLTGLLLLVVVLAFFIPRVTDVKFKHTATTVYDPPKFLGTIEMQPGFKPAWVYSAKGRLYVNYFGKDQVDIFTPAGKKVKSFHGTLKPGSGTPQGMSLVGEKLFVADYENRAVLLFKPNGDYLESYAKRPDGTEFIPVGVADYDRIIYMTDKKVNGWLAIGETGEFINVVKGDEKNTLKFPYGIIVTDDGRVVVTDPVSGKIKVFSCPGWYIGEFPAAEVGLSNPQGIAIDGFGRIHVVDNGTNQIFVYDNRGRFMFEYGTDLEGPSTVTVDTERRVIYIANTEKENISVWGY